MAYLTNKRGNNEMIRFDFDTYAFLPANAPGYQWQRFTLEMTETEHNVLMEQREKLAEEANRTGRWATYRTFDRNLVRKYSV